MLCMACLYTNNQLLARVIFTPLVALEPRNYEVDTTTQDYNPHQLKLQLFKIFQKAKSANFKPPQIASNWKNAKF